MLHNTAILLAYGTCHVILQYFEKTNHLYQSKKTDGCFASFLYLALQISFLKCLIKLFNLHKRIWLLAFKNIHKCFMFDHSHKKRKDFPFLSVSYDSGEILCWLKLDKHSIWVIWLPSVEYLKFVVVVVVVYIVAVACYLKQGIWYVDGWCASLTLFVQHLVVNYHLVISYPQQWHIGININH